MASSRIFVKGLPPTFDEAQFRKHFGQKGQVTDAKIFPNRRIGYVGFKTSEDAEKAVKYFNKTFIRMSRIGVEIARPIDESPVSRRNPTAKVTGANEQPVAEDNKLKRKRDSGSKKRYEATQDDPKLKEFLESYKSRADKKALEIEPAVQPVNEDTAGLVEAGESDDEYEQVPKKTKRTKSDSKTSEDDAPMVDAPVEVVVAESAEDNPATHGQQDEAADKQPMTDADWARSRTSRLLGLLDDDEDDVTPARQIESASEAEEVSPETQPEKHTTVPPQAATSIPTPPAEEQDEGVADKDIEAVRSTMRLFVRNLPFDVKYEDLEAEFSPFGNLEQIHIPLDKTSGSSKGFAYVQYTDPDSAEKALVDRDGRTFQGRLIHILPATAKREKKIDDFELAKLPLKKQQEIKRKREAANTVFNWNALYMNQDAVISSVASRLGLAKSEVLDPTSSDAAVKQAHAETHIIQETKSYFRQQGVDLDSFKKSARGDTAILIKNIPSDCSRDELKRLFDEQGDVKRFLMPPAGTIAIVEYSNAAQCKVAFGTLAYRRVKSSVLFLEKAPKDVFSAKPIDDPTAQPITEGVNKLSTSELKDSTVADTAGSATLFVRNLNFSTTTALLTETFRSLAGFLNARVKMRTDPKRGELSMGFGFLEFRTPKEAQAALQVMDGYSLEGHKLQIRASHRGEDAAEKRKKADKAKKAATTKVIIKNLPFEATKKDVRSLFGEYGQLRSVRVPKKMDRGARGFAFADFTTVKEAQSAMDALKDTHLLGRRLVLDFAAEDPEDAEAEIEKMQQKVGAQANKVALQKLAEGGKRKKFTTQQDADEDA
ncbi:Putative RNA recognition motif domain, nucleotide-binding alpha-beta plait domain superfamily [Septoria linicola]|uniref:Multiple RNA-binding domain-containing protein 1 n=1 Tax=Septoria linicola TaxID=215465 RepID=A0A9Q9AU48_9PEZI|nr:putative RNA recognition motif domain, nucleotide-binding alpha-beta plait domain superfamily [Septoria linicola]USW53243.1 Putative RNA recognition motif domain, nucleotide-binding alpha-beta plait domain superfamily [Septoria linicola]